MDIAVSSGFSTSGTHSPVTEESPFSWYHRGSWSNQHGRGVMLEFNLIWFYFAISITRPVNVPMVAPFGVTDDG